MEEIENTVKFWNVTKNLAYDEPAGDILKNTKCSYHKF
jgi:hypothetical protein